MGKGQGWAPLAHFPALRALPEFEIAALRDKVDRLTLRAPFTGRITELMVKPYAKMEIGTPLVALSASWASPLASSSAPMLARASA